MDEKLDTRNGFYVQPIGHVQSCFKACLGAAAVCYLPASVVS